MTGESDAAAPIGGATRTILAVNPSHITATESEFWREFGSVCAANGWRLVQFACRSIPQIADAETFTTPARLADFHRWSTIPPRRREWLGPEAVERHVEWEHRRWELPRYDPSVWTGAVQLGALVDQIITALRPAVVLTTNKIDHPCAFARTAAQHHGIPVVGLVERSPFESLWYEPDGLFSESTIWSTNSRWRVTANSADVGRQIVDRLVRNPGGFRSHEISSAPFELGATPRPYVFLPFDNALWTGWLPLDHPQGTIDYPILRDPTCAIEQIAGWVDRVGGTLIIKAHPACRETSKLGRPPGTLLIDSSLDSLLRVSDAVIAFNTKVAFAALAHGIPTVSMTQNPAAASGLTHHWDDFDSPDLAFESALNASPADSENVTEFFGQLELGHFHPLPVDSRPASGVVELFRQLREPLSEGSLSTSSRPDVAELRAAATAVAPRSGRPVVGATPRRVVLVADRLVQPDGQWSGIFRYGRALLDRLERTEGVETHVLVTEPAAGWSRAAAPLFARLRSELGPRLHAASRSGGDVQTVLGALGPLTANDIVHTIHLPLPPLHATGDAARVLTIHDVLHLVHPELRVTDRTPTIERIVQSIDAEVDHIICDSESTRRDLLSVAVIDGHRVTTIPLGADPPCRCDAPTVTRHLPAFWSGYVLTLIQSEPRKNSAAMLEAAAQVLSSGRIPDVGLVTVGPNTHSEDLQRTTAVVGKKRHVNLSDVGDHDMHHLYADADVFVYPSVYEGFGLPPLEAMACGCAVIAVAGSSLVEVVGDAGLYAHSGAADALADALHLVLSSPTLRAELQRRGAARAAQLSWDRTVTRTLEYYELVAQLTRGAHQ